MAAGRDNVLRRRESYKHSSNKEFDYYSNGSSGVAVHHRSSSRHHVTYKNCWRSSDFEDPGRGRTESYGKREEREQGEFYGGNGKNAPAFVFQENHGEAVDGENAHAQPEKRRKISPVVWDLAEKEVKISSKNRTAQVTALSPFCPSQQSSHGASGVSYGGAVNPESPADFSSVFPQGHSGNDGEYVDQSDRKHVQGWNITMSRWLSDDCSPSNDSDDDCMHVKGTSSPESGEFIYGSSEGKESRSSSNSAGADCCCPSTKEDNDSEKELLVDTMDDDEEHSETSNVSNPSSDPEDSGGLVPVQRSINSIQSCRSVLEFEMIKKINEGTYGVVYKAKDKKTGEIVALKKVKMNLDRDGFPLSSLREINILTSFNHPSIVEVKEVVVDDFDGVFMVMEYMEYDLKGLIQLMKRPFSIGETKSLMMKLLKGVKYLHDNWVLHRDLKTSNILLSKDGELICDFGLSRHYGSPLKPYTPLVVTLWYRAPELLLGAKEYSTAIDMWSIGCIMAELVAKSPLFRGKSEIEQINNIIQTLGTPNENIWPGVSKLSGFKANFVKQPHNLLRKKFPVASFIGSPVLSELGFDLLSKFLTYDPEKRISAEAALLHDWFHEAPLPNSDFKFTLPSQSC